MRYYISQCRYCSYLKSSCKTKANIKDFFKNINIENVSSIRLKCKDFKPIAKVGDIIEFEMCGSILRRPVLYVENNYKTFIILTSNNQRNKELFTLTSYDFRGDEHYKKYYSDEEHYNIKNNLMLGFVNYKYIKRVIKNVNIPNMEWENKLDCKMFDFLIKGIK